MPHNPHVKHSSARHFAGSLTGCVRVGVSPERLNVLVMAVVDAGRRAQVVGILHVGFRETASRIRVIIVTRGLGRTEAVPSIPALKSEKAREDT